MTDLRVAMRGLRKGSRFSSFAVILTLTIGIGANTAAFSVVDAVLVGRFPIPLPTVSVELTLQTLPNEPRFPARSERIRV